MIELKVERNDVNVELLDAQLRAIGGDAFYGLSVQRGGITLCVSETASDTVQKQLMQAARQHDAAQVTDQQKAETERADILLERRKEPLLNPEEYVTSDALLRALADKVAWLEQEVRDLRGL